MVLLHSGVGLQFAILLPPHAEFCEHRHAPRQPAQRSLLTTKILPTAIIRLYLKGEKYILWHVAYSLQILNNFPSLNLPYFVLLSEQYGICRVFFNRAFSMYLRYKSSSPSP